MVKYIFDLPSTLCYRMFYEDVRKTVWKDWIQEGVYLVGVL